MATYSAETFTTRQPVAAGVTNSYTDSLFTGVSSADNGGALYVVKTGRVIVTGSTFSSNTAADSGTTKKSGGGVYIEAYASGAGTATAAQRSTFSNSLFTGNTAGTFGGGLYIGGYCYMTLTGSTFSNNIAVSGGGFYNGANGIVSNGYNVLVTGNTATDLGGGLYCYSTANLRNYTFKNNIAQNGGGIYESGGTLKFFGTKNEISGNTASAAGGGIYDKYIFTMDNQTPITVKDNIAGTDGGGLYYVSFSAKTTSKNSGIINAAFTGNSAGRNGGAIYSNGASGDTSETEAVTGRLNITNSLLSGNTAGSNGGAIYNAGTMTISGSTISGNFSKNGSAIYNNGSTSSLALTGSTISGNTASAAGAICSKDGTLTITGSLITGNIYTCTSGGDSGTAISLSSSKLTMTGSTVSGNKGQRTIFDNGTRGVDISNSLFQDNISNNEARGNSNWGGGYCVVNTGTTTAAKDFNFTSVTFNSNTAACSASPSNCYGGAIMTYRYNGTFNIENCDFAGNYAANRGGAIAFYSGTNNTVLMDKSTFTRNYSGNRGGAVYMISGYKLTMTGSTFTGNTSSDNGGAMAMVNDDKEKKQVFSISGAVFENNRSDKNGGAVYMESYFTGSITGSTFSGNIAAELGGALYVNAAVTIENCAFLTSSDTIYAQGALTLTGSNEFAADIYSKNAITAAGSTATFSNTDTITVTGALNGLATANFKGKTVNFVTKQNFNNTAITITCDMTQDIYKIVAGDLGFAADKTITIYDTAGGKEYTVAINSEIKGTGYLLKYEDYNLKIVKNDVEAPSNCVTTAADIVNPKDNLYSLREAAITYKKGSGVTAVTFGNSVTETVKLTDGDLVFGENDSYAITGNANGTSISGRIDNSGTLDIRGAGANAYLVFDGSSTSVKGGAIYTLGSVKADLTYVKFTGNTANSNGGAVCYDTTIATKPVIDNCIFTGNTAGGRGGALYSAGRTGSGKLYVKNSTFTDNYATGSGGACHVASANCAEYSNLTITGNISEQSGGGVYAGSTLPIYGSTISGNTAAASGGGVYSGALLTLDNNCHVNDNISNAYGGGFYCGGWNINMRGGGTVSHNYAANDGGGIYSKTDCVGSTATKISSVTNVLITGNTAGNIGGGAVFVPGSGGSGLVRIDGGTFSGNLAGKMAGALYQTVGGTVSNTLFTGNTAATAGAMYYTGSTATDNLLLDKVAFTGNTATGHNAGALFLNGAAQVDIIGSTFTGNVAGNLGGAIYNAGTVSIQNSVITGNFGKTGSAIYNSGAASFLTLSGSTVSANTASVRAAIYSNGGTLTIENSLITGNLAEDNAGLLGTAVSAAGTNLVITGSTVSDNVGMRTITHDGAKDLTFDGNLFQNNYSFRGAANNSSWGGALAMVNVSSSAADKTYSFTNSDFIGNTVTSELYPTDCSGGALMFLRHNGTFIIDNCNFTGNYSSNKGGAVSFYSGTGNTATVKNSTFSGNVGKLGGAIFANSGYALTIQDSKFLTSSDTIYADGALTLSGSNEFAADIYSKNAITAAGSTATFVNTEVITVTGALTGLSAANFNGETVNFATAQDFSSTAISITAAIPAVTGTITVASGDFTFGATQTISVKLGDAAAQNVAIGGTLTVENNEYLLSYSAESKKLEIRFNAKTAETTGSVTSGTAVKDSTTGETTGYAAEWIDTTTVSSGKQIFAGGELGTLDGTLIIDGTDLSGKMVFGGSNDNEAESGTKTIQFKSGTAGSLLAGGMTKGSDGNTVLEIAGGTITNAVYAGARNITGGSTVTVTGGIAGQQIYGGVLNADVAGNVTMNLQAGTMVGSAGGNLISGGSRITGGSHSIGGEISVNVGGSFDVGTAETNLYGAGMAIASGAALTTGDINIDISGGNLGEAVAGRGVFGGGFADKGSVTSQNVTIDLTSGSFGNVFGGGWAQQGGSSTVNSVEINVSGDVTGSNIYGGGAHSNNPAYTSNTAVGSVAITITDNTNLTSVFAGGQYNQKGTDTVTGTAAITVSGTYANGFTTNLYGGGYYGVDTVAGISALDLQNFTGSMKNIIGDFDKVVFSGDSEVNFSSAELNNQQHNGWEFDFTGRTAAKAGSVAAVFDDVFGSFSLLTNADLFNADSWKLFSAAVSSFDDDWAMDISYDGGISQEIAIGESIKLGGTDWELTSLDTNDPSGESDGTRLVMLSKKTTF